MHIESLAIFCDLVKKKSFSQTAEQHGVTQSAVSQIVRNLEKHSGRKLVERGGRNKELTLTPAGEELYEYGTGIVRLWTCFCHHADRASAASE